MSTETVHPAIAGTANWQCAVREYIERLRAHYGQRLVSVVLYGSRARGDDEQDSDVDLLVVLAGDVDHSVEQEQAADLRGSLEERYDYPLLGPVIATEAEYRQRMLPLFMNVRREGIVLWPPGGTSIRDEHGKYDESLGDEVGFVMGRARETLREAQYMIEQKFHRAAVNRAYYAMFHAATALLLRDALAYSKHRGVIGAFRRLYVRTGKFDPVLGDQLASAFEARNLADYAYREGISAEIAEGLVRSAQAFVSEAQRLLES